MVDPQGLQLLKSTADSLLVSWEPSSEVDYYLLSYYPLGKQLSAKQIQVPKAQHSSEILGLLPGTKYIVTLRNVKKEVPSSPQHLLATTGEEAARCPRCPKRCPILLFLSIIRPLPRFGAENTATTILGSGEKSQFSLPCFRTAGTEPAGWQLNGSSLPLRLVRSDCLAPLTSSQGVPLHPQVLNEPLSPLSKFRLGWARIC